MRRLCVIGDSHIGPLILAARQGHFIDAGCVPTFFCAHEQLMLSLARDGRRLVAPTPELAESLRLFSGGSDVIDLDAYDAFVVIGLGLWMGRCVLYTYKDFTADSIPSPAEGKYLLSDASYVATGIEAAQQAEVIRIAAMIRQVTDSPLAVVCAPNPGSGLSIAQLAEWYPPAHGAVRNGDDQALSHLFHRVCDALAQRHRIRVVPPLAAIAENGIFNRRQFSLLPEDLASVPESELMNRMVHASDDCGLLLVRELFGEGQW
jgi:hypothetical protein